MRVAKTLLLICCNGLCVFLVIDFDTIAYARDPQASQMGAADILGKWLDNWLGPIINPVTATFTGALVAWGVGLYREAGLQSTKGWWEKRSWLGNLRPIMTFLTDFFLYVGLGGIFAIYFFNPKLDEAFIAGITWPSAWTLILGSRTQKVRMPTRQDRNRRGENG